MTAVASIPTTVFYRHPSDVSLKPDQPLNNYFPIKATNTRDHAIFSCTHLVGLYLPLPPTPILGLLYWNVSAVVAHLTPGFGYILRCFSDQYSCKSGSNQFGNSPPSFLITKYPFSTNRDRVVFWFVHQF